MSGGTEPFLDDASLGCSRSSSSFLSRHFRRRWRSAAKRITWALTCTVVLLTANVPFRDGFRPDVIARRMAVDPEWGHYFQVTSIAKKWWKTVRAGLLFWSVSGLRMKKSSC